MPFHELTIKGVSRYLIDERLEGEPLHLHISAVAAGGRSHPPHQHGGYEAFYMLEGVATLEIDDERQTIRAGEVAVFDPQRMHGLLNESDAPIRYIVILEAMTSGLSRAMLARYVACYAIWVALCALMGVALFQAVAALLEISIALRLNPWVGRAVRQLSLPVLGIAWLVLIFWSEHVLRQSVPRGNLLRRALRFAIPLLVVLALLWLIQALL